MVHKTVPVSRPRLHCEHLAKLQVVFSLPLCYTLKYKAVEGERKMQKALFENDFTDIYVSTAPGGQPVFCYRTG